MSISFKSVTVDFLTALSTDVSVHLSGDSAVVCLAL